MRRLKSFVLNVDMLLRRRSKILGLNGERSMTSNVRNAPELELL
jgi:hypothetical protein